jgi:DNA-binding XRE family transcriptional regulator
MGRFFGERIMTRRTIPFEEVEQELLQDPEVRKAYEDLEPAYQIARLRILRGMTQEQLATLVGTQQPSIARLESGKTTPALPFLRRIADALDARLTITLEPCEEVTDSAHQQSPII